MPSPGGYAIRQLGPVVICPTCSSACREGSPYYLENNGQCGKCKVAMVVDRDLARTGHRNQLYEFTPLRKGQR